jgi:uncharacterized membrane protein HdeD (DUF308 family)
MLTMLSKNWWVVALRGAISIIFGILLLIAPPLVITSMVLFFGAYVLVDGVSAIFTAVQNRNQARWWYTLLEGIIGVIAGILVFAYPLFATIAAVYFVLYVVAFWAILGGIFQIMQAIELRKEIEGEIWLGLSGLLSLLFGVFLIFAPGAGILALLTIIAAYAIVFGVMLIILAFRLRGHGSQGQPHSGTGTRQPV